jgi:hypothetical protein
MESLIRLEASLGHTVHVVALNTEKHWVTHPESPFQGVTLEAITASTKPSVSTALANLFSSESYYASRFWTPEVSSVVREQARSADVVVLDSLFMAVYLDEVGSVPTVLRAHNVEHAIWMRGLSEEPWYRRGYVALQAKRLKIWESQVAQRVDRIWAISPEDARWFRDFGPAHTLACTYDPVHGSWPDSGASAPKAYHLGALDWTPNVRGMKWFLEEVAPLLHHAGVDVYSRQWPFGSAPKGVRYRADQPDFAEYGIFIAPIRSGSGMRIKLLEAMARGKAIVTTPLGAEGLNASHGTHLLLADSPSEFAAAMDELHQSAELRSKLGSAAALHARAQFSDHSAADGIARELATFAS